MANCLNCSNLPISDQCPVTSAGPGDKTGARYLYLNVRSWPSDGAHRSTLHTRISNHSSTDTRWNLHHIFLNFKSFTFPIHNKAFVSTYMKLQNKHIKTGQMTMQAKYEKKELWSIWTTSIHSSCTVTTVGQVGFPPMLNLPWLDTCLSVILATPGARLNFIEVCDLLHC